MFTSVTVRCLQNFFEQGKSYSFDVTVYKSAETWQAKNEHRI